MKIILCGACGRMGKNVTELSSQFGAEIVCGVDTHPAPMPYPVYQTFLEEIPEADVLIDFSSAEDLETRLAFCKKRNLAIVVAFTGYSQTDEAPLNEYSKSIPIFRSGNFSIGINLLQLLAKQAATILGNSFDAEIIERHHNQKKDAPSGTALMLANTLHDAYNGTKQNVYGRYGMVGARSKSEIGIHAVRGGTIVGEHEIMFAGEDEIITLSHSARSRKVFAQGALRAAQWLTSKTFGTYNMDDMLADMINL